MKQTILFLYCAFFLPAFMAGQETLHQLALQFVAPKNEYKPQAWWHWLGTNVSGKGITADLEAMKQVGVNGVIVFNAPSWLDTTQNLYRHQTYRSPAYYEMLGHTLSEARRLSMTVGLHNSPGWSTTGGPWITPEQGMQRVEWTVTETVGGSVVALPLPQPEDACYRDVAVFAVSEEEEVLDVSQYFARDTLTWKPHEGKWKMYRLGYLPTRQRSHPTPEDVEHTALEVDKMNPEHTRLHWRNVLQPLTERFGDYIGSTFTIIWTDSYESWGQNWSENFRADFIGMKNYDPVRALVIALARGEEVFDAASFHVKDASEMKYEETKRFVADYADVINRLYLDCFRIGSEMIHEAGFQYYWEPYGSIIDAPFDMEEGESIADVPTTEFWVHSVAPVGDGRFAPAAARSGKRLVAAEAFTGMEATCTFNETPAMLKAPADMAFNYGVNQLFLHSWAHNPLDDTYQPGWGFAHYGTHFGRNQTWHRPSQVFFTYLARCQMLLQQGTFVERNDTVLHRSLPEAELFFVRNVGEGFDDRIFYFPPTQGHPQLWNAYTGEISEAMTTEDGGIRLSLEKDASIFVVFPSYETRYALAKPGPVLPLSSIERHITGKWRVTFIPKTGESAFVKTWDKLVDCSKETDFAVKYFSGTMIYANTFICKSSDVTSGILLDLGTVYDMAEIEINDQAVATLWIAPFRTDISYFVKPGRNTLKIKVTNTWQNRLIGDEQFPADTEWVVSENTGEPSQNGLPRIQGLPDWVRLNKPRPSTVRKTFVPWSYFNKHSPLLPSGMLGEVKLIIQNTQ
jgi:hypothetical protein